MEMHLSMLSNRLNEVTKVLSAIATVILPATLIASIYGMNFRVLPLAEHPYGFWIMLGDHGGGRERGWCCSCAGSGGCEEGAIEREEA